MLNQWLKAEVPTDLADLLGLDHPPGGPPETRNAAPSGSRNGVAKAEEAGQLQAEIYDLLGLASSPDNSPLDRPITVTRFTSAAATRQTREATTLRQFGDVIRSTRAAAKSALPWCKLATFGDDPTAKGSLRHDANLQAVEGIEGDYDAGAVTLDEAAARLQAAGVAALIYTTPSHRPDTPRWRVLAPLSATVTPSERAALTARLNGALGGILAPESFTPSQAYYFGALGDGAAHEVRLVEGAALDALDGLPSIGRRPDRDGAAAPDLDAEVAALLADDDDDLMSLIAPDWARIKEALAFIPADDRDDWLRVGMALHAEGRGGDEAEAVWREWSRQSDKFDARDQARVWRSFADDRRKAVGIGSLYDLAKAHGWSAKPSPRPSHLTFLSPAECEATPSRGYVVKGMIAPGDVGCIFGQPGAGKSLIAPHVGYAVAQGREAFGMRSKPGQVLYVAAEDPHGMRGRVTALKMRHGDADRFTLVEGVSDLLSDNSGDLAALLQAVEDRRPALIFLDTLAMAFPGLEENSAEGMGRVVAVARQLTQWGAAVLIVHHSTKAEGNTPRGHSLFNGALDMALHIERDETGIVRGKLTKNRNGSCDRDIAFLIDTERLGEDEDGDAITAALVNELAAGEAPRAEKLTPEKAALRILEALHDGGGLPVEWVDEDVWRAACLTDRAVSAAEKIDNRKRSIRRLVESLAGKGEIRFDGERVRLTKLDLDDAVAGFDDLEAA